MNLKIYILIFIQIYILVISVYLLHAVFVKLFNKYKNEASEKDAISYRNSYSYLKRISVPLILLNLLTYFGSASFVSNSAYFTMILTSFAIVTALTSPSFYIINKLLDRLYKN